jgi:hypothetical protein
VHTEGSQSSFSYQDLRSSSGEATSSVHALGSWTSSGLSLGSFITDDHRWGSSTYQQLASYGGRSYAQTNTGSYDLDSQSGFQGTVFGNGTNGQPWSTMHYTSQYSSTVTGAPGQGSGPNSYSNSFSSGGSSAQSVALTLMPLMAGLVSVGWGMRTPGMFVGWHGPNQPLAAVSVEGLALPDATAGHNATSSHAAAMDLRQGLPGLAPLTPGDLGIQPPALAVPVFDVTPPQPPPPPVSNSGYRFPRSTIFNDPVLDGTLDRVADAGPNLTAGDGLFYGYYWDGQYRSGHERLAEGASYTLAGAYFVLSWNLSGPTLLTGGLAAGVAFFTDRAVAVGFDVVSWSAENLDSGVRRPYTLERASWAAFLGTVIGGAARLPGIGRLVLGGLAVQGARSGVEALERGHYWSALVDFTGAGLAGAGAVAPLGRSAGRTPASRLSVTGQTRLAGALDLATGGGRSSWVDFTPPLGRSGPIDGELARRPTESQAPRPQNGTLPRPAGTDAAGGAGLPRPGTLDVAANYPAGSTARFDVTAPYGPGDVYNIDVGAHRPTAGAHEPVQVGGPGTPPMQAGQTTGPGGRGPIGGGSEPPMRAGLGDLRPPATLTPGTNPVSQRTSLQLIACFAAGMQLRTPDGFKLVERIRPGDLLLSRSEFDPTSPVLPKVVERVFVRLAEILHLHVQGRLIRTTADHPFFLCNEGWVAARELKPGDNLVTEYGGCVEVERVLDTGKYEPVYNVRVADFHTYFVGNDEWGFSVWAHNAFCDVLEALEERGILNENHPEAYGRVRDLYNSLRRDGLTDTEILRRINEYADAHGEPQLFGPPMLRMPTRRPRGQNDSRVLDDPRILGLDEDLGGLAIVPARRASRAMRHPERSLSGSTQDHHPFFRMFLRAMHRSERYPQVRGARGRMRGQGLDVLDLLDHADLHQGWDEFVTSRDLDFLATRRGNTRRLTNALRNETIDAPTIFNLVEEFYGLRGNQTAIESVRRLREQLGIDRLW